MKADLHIHSTHSDGSQSRTWLLEQAQLAGVTHMAFTEHDTTLDADQAVTLGEAYGITVFRALEISAFDFGVGKKAHILGYNFQTTTHIEALCRPTLLKRHANAVRQIEILQSLGYAITLEEILQYTPTNIIYKQFILDYLVKTGQSDSHFGEIYQNIFKNGGPCDFGITYVDAAKAVRAIHADGGVSCLAHAGQQQNFAIVPSLVQAGMQAIERNHPANSASDVAQIDALAQQFDLYQSGGSDYHGRYEKRNTVVGQFTAHEDFVAMLCNRGR